ncbi:hypothetical protein KCU92_g7764, partial [Aureobasidium melanogenum]
MVQQSEAVAGMTEAGIIDLRFHRSMQAMLAALNQDPDSSSESSNGEEIKEPEEDGEDEEPAADEKPVVPVRPRFRRHAEPALVEIDIAMKLAPFDLTEPSWTSQLALVLRSRGIVPEDMEGLQHLLLDLLSRSRAQGVVVLAEQWRRTQQYIAAWIAAINGPSTRDSMFPGFTKQMVVCLKAEATENISQVFNLVEYVGLANKLNKALSAMSSRHGDDYQTNLAWRRQQGRRGGSRGSYESIRKFIIHQAVTNLFDHEPESTAANLKLVNLLVRRAEVLRALELAFGPGVFVLLLGFNWKLRRETAWNEGTEAILKSLANSCPMLRRVCSLANRNIWSKVVNNEQLDGPKLNAELLNISDRGNKDLLTLLSLVGEQVTEVEELDMEDV